MKRLNEIIAIPGVVCLLVLMFFGQWIVEHMPIFFWIIVGILIVAVITNAIQTDRDRKQQIAANAVAEFKKERNIVD